MARSGWGRWLVVAVGLVAALPTAPAQTLEVESRRKPGEAWKKYPTRTLRQLAGYKAPAALPELNRYGGLEDGTCTGTGFFRTEKVGNRWWLVDPEGGKFFHVGVASVRPGTGDTSRDALKATFGSTAKWAEETNELLREHGFRGTGAWSDASLQEAPGKVPYTLIWNFMSSYGAKRGGTYRLPGHTGYPGRCIFLFDPEFEAFCEQHARKLAATRDDPWLVGHFSDNEMPLDEGSLERYLALPPSDHGHKAARQWLEEYRRKNPAEDATTITAEAQNAFLEFAVDRYCRIVAGAVRKVDPNHLFLGTRWNGPAVRLPAIYRGAGPHVDVHSVNYYNAWTPRPDRLAMWEAESGKPAIISEFYVKGMDSGLGNSSGAGWEVRTQEDRGHFYQNYVLALIESGTCVGWHWFRYMDNDPAEKNADASNQDSNKGIVDASYRPHSGLLAAMGELNREVYALAAYFDGKKEGAAGGGKRAGRRARAAEAEETTAPGQAKKLKAPPGVVIRQDISYLEPHRREKLDLYLPETRKPGTLSPAMVLIHGGGWVGGDKGAAREVAAGAAFAKAGYVCASVEYSKEAGNRWPTNLLDCKNAVRFLRKNAAELGIDPERIGVMGGSAGGHLALMVAYTSGTGEMEPESPYPGIRDDVAVCVNLYGITNLLTRQRTEKDGTPNGTLVPTAALLTVSREEDPELWKQASPVSHVSGKCPPTLILHGSADTTVDRDQATELAERLKEAGVPHELHIIPGAPHSFHFTGKPVKADVQGIVMEFVGRYLTPPS